MKLASLFFSTWKSTISESRWRSNFNPSSLTSYTL